MHSVSLIGLDGAPWSLVRPWLEDGHLPNLRKITENGVDGTLYSTIPSRTSPAVPALYTGCDPSELGFSGFQKPDGSTITIKDIDIPTIWTALGEHDAPACAANVRTTYPPPEITGVMVAGDPAPSEDSDYFYPSEISKDVAGFRMHKKDRRRHEDLVPAGEHIDEVLSLSIEILEERFERFKRLSDREDFLFEMFWIGGTDFLQHRLWDYPDRLLDFYQVADRVIGEVRDRTKGNTIVVSDHGFYPPSDLRFHANEWLYREGYLTVHGGTVGKRIQQTGQKLARKHLDPSILIKLLTFTSGSGDDQESPPWFENLYDGIPGISGHSDAVLSSATGITVTATGDAGEAIQNEIIQKLRSLETPDGRPVMKHVWTRSETYEAGRYIESLPEVVFQPSKGINIKPRLSGSLFEPDDSDHAGHVHAREGIMCATGPDFVTGSIDANIIDIAPTILSILGIPPGAHMQGRILAEALVVDSPDTGRTDYRALTDESSITADEREEMEEWLADMGYI